MSGLVKLTIEAYELSDFDQSESSIASFSVMFNPEHFKRNAQVEYEKKKGKGKTAKSQKFKGIKEESYQLQFMLDGTGIATVEPGKEPEPFDVTKKVGELKELLNEVRSSTHRTVFTKVHFGEILIRCVIEKMDVEYTLFGPEGNPIRAKVNLVFKSAKSPERREADDRKESADLTHVVTVKQGDRLDYLTFKTYRDPTHYIRVARFNGLSSFRQLRVGQKLRFPPLKNKTENAERQNNT